MFFTDDSKIFERLYLRKQKIGKLNFHSFLNIAQHLGPKEMALLDAGRKGRAGCAFDQLRRTPNGVYRGKGINFDRSYLIN